jgi:hypothetical protein
MEFGPVGQDEMRSLPSALSPPKQITLTNITVQDDCLKTKLSRGAASRGSYSVDDYEATCVRSDEDGYKADVSRAAVAGFGFEFVTRFVEIDFLGSEFERRSAPIEAGNLHAHDPPIKSRKFS